MSDDVKDVSTRGAIVAIALAMIVIALLLGMAVLRGTGGVSTAPNKDKFQAVFLTNGQVYFGHLRNVGGSSMTLEDVYYIQSQNATQGTGTTASPQPNLSLVALGEEIHGPEREMVIQSEQVIFWENLKSDGKVAKAIEENQKK